MKKIYIILAFIWTLVSLDASASSSPKNRIGSAPPNCNAQFSYTVDNNNSLLIHFSDQSTGIISNYYWNFGDGTTSTSMNPSHTYTTAGAYFITLTVNDSNYSCIDSTTLSITIANNPPPCNANFSQQADSVNSLLIHFTNLSTGNLINYNWNFGDGTSSTNFSPNHLYTAAGIYTVLLSVSDSASTCTDTISQVITVNNNAQTCQSLFSHTVSTNNNLTITFSDQSQGNPFLWNWDFGDGITSSSQNPTHTYSVAGTYTVSLNITAQNCSDTSTQQIVVLPNSNTGSLLVYVFADSIYLDSGLVFLYQLDSLSGLPHVKDSVYATYSQGVTYYNFSNIPQGLYYVYATVLPGSPQYNQYYNSWATNSYSWQAASSILVNSNNNWTSIILQKSNVSYPSGTGRISGAIVNKANGNSPEIGVDVYLLLNDSSIISKKITNQQGQYEFDNLAFGTYIIHPEITGKYTNNKSITLDFDHPTVDTIVFVIDGNQIITTIDELDNSATLLSIYPNPFKDIISIRSNTVDYSPTIITITDTRGRILYSENIIIRPNLKKSINLSKLNKGLYFITIRTNTIEVTNKIIKF